MPDLLFLCHRVPYPPNKGEKIRAWHILTPLARTHRVRLGCSEKWRDYAPRHGRPMRAIDRPEADTLLAFERRAAMAFDRALFISEARHFAAPAAFEGVQALPERDLIVCAGAKETARRIVEILDGRHRQLPAAARRAVGRNHDGSSTLRRLDAVFPTEDGKTGQRLASRVSARSGA